MSIIRIYGASDDLVEFEGVQHALDKTDDHGQDSDNYPEASDDMAEFPVYLENTKDSAEFIIGNQLIVRARYSRLGSWTFEIDYTDEVDGRPNWSVIVRPSEEVKYSSEVTIDCDLEEITVVRTS